ncbi:MAG: type I-E CRISPR-associated protein Cse1/CasA, partial [Firmicutes bacterium]|nr:type I-E CRISPR-associated protein Cse1/CasA [Bacillota bacterium]
GNTKGQYIPNKHSIERNLWRDLGSILPQADGTNENIIPGVVRWMTLLRESNLLEEGIIQLCAVGFQYGPMEAKVDAMAVDTLLIHNGIFTKLGSKWMPLINNLLRLTDDCVRRLAVLASDLAKAAGDIDSLQYRAGEGKVKASRAEAYYRMDEPFRRWLAAIDPLETDMGEAEQEWIGTLKRLLFQLGTEMSYQYGEKAIVGRWVDEKRGSRRESNLYTAPGALAKFRRGVVQTITKGG